MNSLLLPYWKPLTAARHTWSPRRETHDAPIAVTMGVSPSQLRVCNDTQQLDQLDLSEKRLSLDMQSCTFWL